MSVDFTPTSKLKIENIRKNLPKGIHLFYNPSDEKEKKKLGVTPDAFPITDGVNCLWVFRDGDSSFFTSFGAGGNPLFILDRIRDHFKVDWDCKA